MRRREMKSESEKHCSSNEFIELGGIRLQLLVAFVSAKSFPSKYKSNWRAIYFVQHFPVRMAMARGCRAKIEPLPELHFARSTGKRGVRIGFVRQCFAFEILAKSGLFCFGKCLRSIDTLSFNSLLSPYSRTPSVRCGRFPFFPPRCRRFSGRRFALDSLVISLLVMSLTSWKLFHR